MEFNPKNVQKHLNNILIRQGVYEQNKKTIKYFIDARPQEELKAGMRLTLTKEEIVKMAEDPDVKAIRPDDGPYGDYVWNLSFFLGVW